MKKIMVQNKPDHLHYYPKQMKRNNITMSAMWKKKAELVHQ
jgi:hypothetical protein